MRVDASANRRAPPTTGHGTTLCRVSSLSVSLPTQDAYDSSLTHAPFLASLVFFLAPPGLVAGSNQGKLLESIEALPNATRRTLVETVCSAAVEIGDSLEASSPLDP